MPDHSGPQTMSARMPGMQAQAQPQAGPLAQPDMASVRDRAAVLTTQARARLTSSPGGFATLLAGITTPPASPPIQPPAPAAQSAPQMASLHPVADDRIANAGCAPWLAQGTIAPAVSSALAPSAAGTGGTEAAPLTSAKPPSDQGIDAASVSLSEIALSAATPIAAMPANTAMSVGTSDPLPNSIASIPPLQPDQASSAAAAIPLAPAQVTRPACGGGMTRSANGDRLADATSVASLASAVQTAPGSTRTEIQRSSPSVAGAPKSQGRTISVTQTALRAHAPQPDDVGKALVVPDPSATAQPQRIATPTSAQASRQDQNQDAVPRGREVTDAVVPLTVQTSLPVPPAIPPIAPPVPFGAAASQSASAPAAGPMTVKSVAAGAGGTPARMAVGRLSDPATTAASRLQATTGLSDEAVAPSPERGNTTVPPAGKPSSSTAAMSTAPEQMASDPPLRAGSLPLGVARADAGMRFSNDAATPESARSASQQGPTGIGASAPPGIAVSPTAIDAPLPGPLPAAALPVNPTQLASAPAAAGHATPAPAEQLAPVLVRMASGDAPDQISIRLAPEALGRVDITISRPADGTARIAVSVERPETLAALRGDQASLNQALDRAGIPSDSRTVSFELAARTDATTPSPFAQAAVDSANRQPPSGAHANQSGFDTNMAQTGTPGGQNHGGQHQSGDAGSWSSGQGGGSWGRSNQTRSGPDDGMATSAATSASPATRAEWSPTGINFTA